MSKFMGRTIEWDGWWFDIEPRLIRARPAKGHRGIGRYLEFRFDDLRDDLILRHIRLIMETVNAGARLRSRQIRECLGIQDERNFNPADLIWNDSSPKYWVNPGRWGSERGEMIQ